MRLKILGIHDGHNASATLLEDGWNVLVGSDIEKIVKAIKGFEAKGMQKKVFDDEEARIQEEATAPNINKKVFVLRKSIERQEVVEAGYAEVVGTDASNVLSNVLRFIENPNIPTNSCPFGDGNSGKVILSILEG